MFNFYNYFHILLLTISIGIYVVLLCNLKRFRHIKLMNFIFVFISFSCYITFVMLAMVEYHEVFDLSNRPDVLPPAKPSTLILFTCPIYLLLRGKAREWYFSFVSILSLAMIFAIFPVCIFSFLDGYSVLYFSILNVAPHVAFSLWGVYLVQTKQVEVNFKNAIIGGGILLFTLMTMLVLNKFLNTDFYGLATDDRFNIYDVKVVDNPHLSAFLFTMLLLIASVFGFFYQKLLMKIRHES